MFATVLPRLLFDGWRGDDYGRLFSDDDRLKRLCTAVRKAVRSHGADGVVVEVWSQLGGQHSTHLIRVIRQLGAELAKAKSTLVLVIPPPVYHGYHLFCSINLHQFIFESLIIY